MVHYFHPFHISVDCLLELEAGSGKKNAFATIRFSLVNNPGVSFLCFYSELVQEKV